jgi:hypothetical protein
VTGARHGVFAALAGTGVSGCGKSTPSATPTPGATVSAAGSPPAPTTPPAPAAGAGDWCTFAIRIGTDSGMLVNKHYISPLDETLDQFKAVVNMSLAAGNQLLTGIPDDVRAALLVEMQYFQALKDHNFGVDTPTPPGLDAALAVVNQYQVSACGITFDQ